VVKPICKLVQPRRLSREGAIGSEVVEQIKRYIAEHGLGHYQKLPPERALCRQLGMSRSHLRKALAEMEADGLIWRHVGRGTFTGSKPVHNLDDLAFLGELANPAQMLEARLAIEPQLARLAALHRTPADVDAIRTCNRRCRSAEDWRSYEAWDSNFHHAVAKATHNKVLLYLFDSLNVVRRSIVWGQKRATRRPTSDHFAFDQHDAIHAAIGARDADAAARAMRDHLYTVGERVHPVKAS
jgi:GntR family uxuAB operon transcriptional repressor